MLHAISFTVGMVGAASFALCWLAGVYSIIRRVFADADERPYFLKRFYLACAGCVVSWLVAFVGALGVNTFGPG